MCSVGAQTAPPCLQASCKLFLRCCWRLGPLPAPDRAHNRSLIAAFLAAHSAEEVPAEGHTDSRFSVKCRWYRSVVTKGGQVRRRGAGRERSLLPPSSAARANALTLLFDAVLLGAPGEGGGDPVHPVPALQGAAAGAGGCSTQPGSWQA